MTTQRHVCCLLGGKFERGIFRVHNNEFKFIVHVTQQLSPPFGCDFSPVCVLHALAYELDCLHLFCHFQHSQLFSKYIVLYGYSYVAVSMHVRL